MNYSRAEIKQQAKGLIQTAKPNVITVGAIYILLGLLLSFLSGRIIGARMTVANLSQYFHHLENGNMDYAFQYFQTLMPTVGEQLMSTVLDLVHYIVTVGWYIFLLATIRGLGASYGNLLDGFGIFLRIILLNILTGLFVLLWSLLFVVPGIIAAYRYRLAVYILIDNPDLSVMDCIRRSKELMRGHKGELFAMDLSFIGWAILTGIPYVGYLAQLWVVPYMDMSYAMYYEQRRMVEQHSHPFPEY